MEGAVRPGGERDVQRRDRRRRARRRHARSATPRSRSWWQAATLRRAAPPVPARASKEPLVAQVRRRHRRPDPDADATPTPTPPSTTTPTAVQNHQRCHSAALAAACSAAARRSCSGWRRRAATAVRGAVRPRMAAPASATFSSNRLGDHRTRPASPRGTDRNRRAPGRPRPSRGSTRRCRGNAMGADS